MLIATDCLPHQVTELNEGWRRLSNESATAEAAIGASSAAANSTAVCDNGAASSSSSSAAARSPISLHGSLDNATWYRFTGAAGKRLLNTAPRAGERCGSEAAGWLLDAHPAAGAAPQLSTVCFAFSWSDCLWRTQVLSCACSFDNGASTLYTYRLPRPPGDPTCVSYCGDSQRPVTVETTGGRRLEQDFEAEAEEEAQSGNTALDFQRLGSDRGRLGNSDMLRARERLAAVALSSSSTGLGSTTTIAASARRVPRASAPSPYPPSNLSRFEIVGYMRDDPRDVGAHLDHSTDATLYGRTPPVAFNQTVELQASMDGMLWFGGVGDDPHVTYQAITYRYYTPPVLSRLWPTAGPVLGGTNVTVSGTGFAGLVGLHTATCRFGADTFTPAYFQNDTYVLCTTPPRRRGLITHPVGRAAFALALNGQDYHSAAAASADVANVNSNSGAATFTFYAAALHSIAPTCGGLHGGQLVTVHGRGFDSLGGLGLDDGGVPLEPRWRLSLVPTSLTAGTQADGQLSSASAALSALSAAGSGEQWSATQPFQSLDATHLVLKLPSTTLVGRYLVQFALNGIDFQGELPFDRWAAPAVQRVMPSGGPMGGGTIITISGEGFRPVAQEDTYLEQWAAAATARSEYSDAYGSASRAVGPPDATGCMRERLEPLAWMPALGTDLPDWLQVSFARPVRPWRWRVLLATDPAAVMTVELVGLNGERLLVPFNSSGSVRQCSCAGSAQLGCSAVVEGYVDSTSFPLVLGMRISTALEGWEAVDAVQLAGYVETQRCMLGEQVAPLVVQNATRLVCITPELPQAARHSAAADNSCIWSMDGLCDVPPFCAAHADCSDCGECMDGNVSVAVQLTFNGRDGAPVELSSSDAVSVVNFTYYPFPIVQALSPQIAMATGGTILTIDATNLDAFGDLMTSRCRFGTRTVRPMRKGPTRMLCRVPAAAVVWTRVAAGSDDLYVAGDVGASSASSALIEDAAISAVAAEIASTASPVPPTVDVSVTLNDQDYHPVGTLRYFHYSLAALHPTGGPTGGGTLLTLRGEGFDSVPNATMASSSSRGTGQEVCRFRYAPPPSHPPALAGRGAAGYLSGGSDDLGAPWPAAWTASTPVVFRSSRMLKCVVPSAPESFSSLATVDVTLNGVDYLPFATAGTTVATVATTSTDQVSTGARATALDASGPEDAALTFQY